VKRFQESMGHLPLRLLRFRTVILWLRRRRRVFVMSAAVAFKSIRDLAEKPFFFFADPDHLGHRRRSAGSRYSEVEAPFGNRLQNP